MGEVDDPPIALGAGGRRFTRWIGAGLGIVLAGLLPVPIAWAFYAAARMWRDEIDHPLADDAAPALQPVGD